MLVFFVLEFLESSFPFVVSLSNHKLTQRNQ